MSKVQSIWETVKISGGGSGFRRFDAEHPLDFYVGLDPLNRSTLLLITQKNPKINLELESVKVHTVTREDGRWSLLFILEDQSLFDLFRLFCEDLIDSSRGCKQSESGVAFVLERLVSWRALFERGSLGLLTEGQVRGLSGELVHLKSLIQTLGMSAAVRSWRGPDRADQDFQFETMGWEVKTVWPSVSEVVIASERQLDYTHRELQLVVLELAAGAGGAGSGFTLNQLVGEIRECLKSDFDVYCIFENSLLKSGYIARAEYDAWVMLLGDIAVYKVGPGFPCLRPQDLPDGLGSVSYKLDLKKCISNRI